MTSPWESLAPGGVVDHVLIGPIQVLWQTRRHEGKAGPEEPSEHVLHDLLALHLAQA